ncbi:MAG TPA: AsmA family protein, partial [Chthoniobacterales bacterium]
MKKVGRLFLIGLGVIIGVGLLILIGVNMYVQSRGTQARIQQELSQRLGTTLRVQRISVTPWAGLKLTAITIPQSQPGVSPDFLTAKAFRLRIRFSSLFGGHLVIKEVSLINPEVVWAQNEDGKWRLPSSLPSAPPKLSVPEKLSPVEAAPSASAPAEPKIALQQAPTKPAPSVATEVEEKQAPFTPEVQRVNVTRARFRFLDRKLQSVATFEDVDFRSSFRTATDLRGNITITRTSLRDRFFLQQLESPLRYDATELDFSQITARAGEGEISGRFTIQPQSEDSP